jgi:hypothetical protein
VLADLELSDGSYLVAGRTVTGFANVEEEFSDSYVGQRVMPWRVEDVLKEHGANYVNGGLFKAFAVRDGRLVTGQQQYSGRKVAQMLIEALGGVMVRIGIVGRALRMNRALGNPPVHFVRHVGSVGQAAREVGASRTCCDESESYGLKASCENARTPICRPLMRPSGLEPPPGKPRTRPSTLYRRCRCFQWRPDRPYRRVFWTHWKHWTVWTLPKCCHGCDSGRLRSRCPGVLSLSGESQSHSR